MMILKGLRYFLTDDLNFYISIFLGIMLAGRKLQKRHFFVGKLVLYTVMFLAWSCAYYSIIQEEYKGVAILRYMFIFIVSIFWCLWLFKCHFLTAMYCVTVAYCLEHIAQRGSSTIWQIIGIKSYMIQEVMLYGTIILVFGTGYKILLKGSTYMGEPDEQQDKMMILIAFIVIFGDIFISLSMMKFYAQTGSKMLMVLNNLSTIIISVLALIVSVSRLRENSERRESVMIRQILDNEQENYQREKAVAEIINIKCHDLKHQLNSLESRIEMGEIEEIRRVVDEYESNLHTGNATLDVALRNKILLCQKKNIDFTCIADGKALDFMKERDVYSLFGNLLDNAIEASEKLKDKEQRVISLTIKRCNFFVFIRMENYYEGELDFENGLPKTIKADKNHHGYGMRSVRFLTEKYDGDLHISTENHIFVVDIMFQTEGEI